MKNEICKREEGGILYAPGELEFPEIFTGRRRLYRTLVFFGCAIILTAMLVAAIVMLFSGESGKVQGGIMGGTDGPDGIVDPETESQMISESEKESDTQAGESESEIVTQAETEGESDGAVGEMLEYIEKDLSQIDKGERFIINYTDYDIDISGLLDRGFADSEAIGGAAPVVMVIHTHTSEEYKDVGGFFRGPLGVVSVGEVIVDELNRAGVNSIHCTVIHDAGDKNSYLEARKTVETMLKIYPSIKYVIDVHRLSLNEGGIAIKPTSPHGSAQVRLSVSAQSGGKEDWRESLSLALSIRNEMNRSETGVCMPCVVMGGGYNADLSAYHILAEVGSQCNSMGEAISAGRTLARSIAKVILE